NVEGASSSLNDLLDGEIFPHFLQSEPLLSVHIEYCHISDDSADDSLSSEREGALAEDLVFSSLRSVFHCHDDSGSRGRHEIHRPAHSLDHLAGDHPIGQISILGNLHSSQKSDVDMRSSNHGEAL
ncbi:hypothetical protein PMAYCL1PPCAC_06826, partial [Pristionchus mayeri]